MDYLQSKVNFMGISDKAVKIIFFIALLKFLLLCIQDSWISLFFYKVYKT